MVGQDLQIWHYDGTWVQSAQFNIPNHEFGLFMDIWGSAPDDIFAIGFADSSKQRHGLIYHYNGKTWSRVNIPPMHYQFSKIRGVKGDNSKYYIMGLKNDNKAGVCDSAHILLYNGSSFKKIFSGFFNNEEALGLDEIDNAIYIEKGNKVYKLINNDVVFFMEYPSTNYLTGISGRSENDILLFLDNGIAHYNGKDVAFLYKFNNPDLRVNNTFCFQNSIYLLAYDYATNFNIILKGKLNN
ncbi:MAG: hypothetical protein ACM3Q2_00165 [Syntrophothermus sp.]